jgi:lipopolysaccharide/colanic/teichoic acid biosynthesis glycosyltransferase
LDLILGVGTALLAVIVAAFVAMVPWLPRITEFLIQAAVKRLPQHQRARFEEEWRGHVNETLGDLDKLDAAIGFLRAARRMARVGKEAAGRDTRIVSFVVEAAAFAAVVLLPISPLLPFFFGQHYNILPIVCIVWTYGGLLLFARKLHPVPSITLYAPLTTADDVRTRNQQTITAGELRLREHGLSPALHRLVDIEYSLALLVLVLPLFLVTAIAIRLESGGPVFDRQRHIGLGGRRFMLFKFRSTYRDDRISHGATDDRYPRLTRIGAIIRKLCIDELPQLINILRDEMSLVGPCPLLPSVATDLERALPFFADRALVKPGLTGWALINRPLGSTSVNDEWLNLSCDLYYVKHQSWLLDMLILFRTFAVIFWSR